MAKQKLRLAFRATAAAALDDFIRISVGNIIIPGSATVCTGGAIKFGLAASFNTSDAKPSWSVMNPEVMTVDAHTGLGTAQSAGLGFLVPLGILTLSQALLMCM